MAALWALMFGAGTFLVWMSFLPRAPRRPKSHGITDGLRDDLAAAGAGRLRVPGLVGLCVMSYAVVFLLAMAATAVPTVSFAFACLGGYLPVAVVRMRAAHRRAQLRDVWPDVVDHVASAVRAGLALPESLAQLSVRGPEPLRPAFDTFARNYRTTGNFNLCLDELKDELSDPVADRLIESMRVAREVGGTDLGRLLRTLSSFLRDDARTRAELEARQSWTVNAARLALCAPWLVLAMLATRGDSLHAYQSASGMAILAIGGGVSLVAYRIMRRIGKLPTEIRVMR